MDPYTFVKVADTVFQSTTKKVIFNLTLAPREMVLDSLTFFLT